MIIVGAGMSQPELPSRSILERDRIQNVDAAVPDQYEQAADRAGCFVMAVTTALVEVDITGTRVYCHPSAL